MRSFVCLLLCFVVWIGYGQAIRDGVLFPRGLNSSEIYKASLSTAAYTTSSHGNASQVTAPGPCYDRWMSWFNSSYDQLGEWTTFVSTYTYHNITAAVTTACDGHPRIVGGTDGLTTTATGTNSTLTSMPKNFTVPTPICTVPPSECTGSLLAWTLCSGTSTQTSDCGPCSIWGGTVELNYFPITRSASQNLCDANRNGSATLCPLAPTGKPYDPGAPFEMRPCDYKTDNITSTRNSGPYLVTDGQTFYQNRVYVSLDTVYASNSCGYVGKQYAGTTLTLASSDIYSIYGYHHELADVGYQFHFDDLSSVPADVYYANCNNGQFPACYYTGSDYRYGTDFLNGRNDIDFGRGQAGRDGHTEKAYQWIFQGAHSPKILVPLQIRTLDPAWATCDLNLVGLYDPPRVLDGQLTYPEPTAPTVPKTSEAAPAATATSGGAPQTAEPRPTETDQESVAYTTPTYTFDPLPTPSSGGSDGDDPGNVEPTAGEQDPAQGTNPPPPATTGPAQPDADPDLVQPSGPDHPADNGQNPAPTPESPGAPSIGDSDDDGAPSIPAASTILASPGEPDHDGGGAPPAATTTAGLGGIIASILGADPQPQPQSTTTTNALSVLQSAAQSYASEQGSAASQSEQQAPPPSQETALQPPEETAPLPSQETAPPQPPEPITFSDEGHAYTLQPVPDGEGVYTVAPPVPSNDVGPHSSSHPQPPAAGPTEHITLTEDGYTQTLQPIGSSSGLYIIVGPHVTSAVPSDYPVGSSPIPSAFSGPATFVADGETHTIRPVPNTSGIFVIDGSRTLTQLPSSATAAGGGTTQGGSGSGSGGAQQSTLISGSGELPPVVTMTSESGPESTSGAGGGSGNEAGGGQGGGGGDVSVVTPTPGGENAASRDGARALSMLWILILIAAVAVMYI